MKYLQFFIINLILFQIAAAQNDTGTSKFSIDQKWSFGMDLMPIIASNDTDSRYYRVGFSWLTDSQNDLLPTGVIRYQLNNRFRLRSTVQYFQKSVTIDDPNHPDLATFVQIDSLGTTNRYFSISVGGEYLLSVGRIRSYIGGEFIYNYQRNAEQYFSFIDNPEVGDPFYTLNEERRKVNTYGGSVVLGVQGMFTERISLTIESLIQFTNANLVGRRDSGNSQDRETLSLDGPPIANPVNTYRYFNDFKFLTLPMIVISYHF